MPFLRCLPLATSLLVLVACNPTEPSTQQVTSAKSTTATSAAATGEALVQAGDISIRANAVQASMLGESAGRQYGIDNAPDTVLLLVTVRRTTGAGEQSLPATVTATVTDLRGGRQEIEMRAIDIAVPGADQALTDHIGTVTTTLPDTLRFDVRVVREDAAVATLQLSRDFYPQ